MGENEGERDRKRETRKERSDRKGETVQEETVKYKENHPNIPYMPQGGRIYLSSVRERAL